MAKIQIHSKKNTAGQKPHFNYTNSKLTFLSSTFFIKLYILPLHHNHFIALFLIPPGEPDFVVQGKINRSRHRPSNWVPLHPD